MMSSVSDEPRTENSYLLAAGRRIGHVELVCWGSQELQQRGREELFFVAKFIKLFVLAELFEPEFPFRKFSQQQCLTQHKRFIGQQEPQREQLDTQFELRRERFEKLQFGTNRNPQLQLRLRQLVQQKFTVNLHSQQQF